MSRFEMAEQCERTSLLDLPTVPQTVMIDTTSFGGFLRYTSTLGLNYEYMPAILDWSS